MCPRPPRERPWRSSPQTRPSTRCGVCGSWGWVRGARGVAVRHAPKQHGLRTPRGQKVSDRRGRRNADAGCAPGRRRGASARPPSWHSRATGASAARERARAHTQLRFGSMWLHLRELVSATAQQPTIRIELWERRDAWREAANFSGCSVRMHASARGGGMSQRRAGTVLDGKRTANQGDAVHSNERLSDCDRH